MARIEFLQLFEGQFLQIFSTRHASGAEKKFISTNNIFGSLKKEDLKNPHAEDEVIEITDVVLAIVDTDHEVTTNQDFDGILEIPSHAIIAWELNDGMPATRPA